MKLVKKDFTLANASPIIALVMPSHITLAIQNAVIAAMKATSAGGHANPNVEMMPIVPTYINTPATKPVAAAAIIKNPNKRAFPTFSSVVFKCENILPRLSLIADQEKKSAATSGVCFRVKAKLIKNPATKITGNHPNMAVPVTINKAPAVVRPQPKENIKEASLPMK
ncbi:MAG: hypothetical protein ACD_44C00393G0002 [uncultured bacterium]|nr:MAG: hypothetical protein ACD_44C00393G0002 [uncultured bacterium]